MREVTTKLEGKRPQNLSLSPQGHLRSCTRENSKEEHRRRKKCRNRKHRNIEPQKDRKQTTESRKFSKPEETKQNHDPTLSLHALAETVSTKIIEEYESSSLSDLTFLGSSDHTVPSEVLTRLSSSFQTLPSHFRLLRPTSSRRPPRPSSDSPARLLPGGSRPGAGAGGPR